MTSPEFRAIYGNSLADQVDAITASPEQQAKARKLEEELRDQRLRAEAQVLKETCDAAENGVYGKQGVEMAERVLAGGRTNFNMTALAASLKNAGLLRRRGKR